MKIEAFRFSDDGDVPNHPHWPMIVYQGALSGSERDAVAEFEDLFARNGWGDGWRARASPCWRRCSSASIRRCWGMRCL